MGRWLALLSLAALVIAAAAFEKADPCKRQPFRGRCPSAGGQPPKRSQFVLRYYYRNGECVSYPYGHCANDDSEPQLYRYKEECEDSCSDNRPGNFTKTPDLNETYGTVRPLAKTPTVSAAEQKDEVAMTEDVTTTTAEPTTTTTTTTRAPTTTTTEETSTTTTTEATTTTAAATTTTTEPSTTISVAESTTTEATTTTASPTTEKTSPSTTTHASTSPTLHETTSAPEEEEDNSLNEDEEEEVQESSASTTTAAPTTPVATTAAPRTECERRRNSASSSKIRGGFIPVCDINGNFQKAQCEPDGRQCFCVNNAGIEITNSRTRNGAKPNCEQIETVVTPKTQACIGGAERGPCSSSFSRYYFDENQQKCLPFVFSGCGGSGNNFESEGDCQRHCVRSKPVEPVKATSVAVTGDICSLPKERGPCDKYELRFFYFPATNECKYFFWGGCDGNANNFENAESCQAACVVSKGKHTNSYATIPGVRVNTTTTTTPSESFPDDLASEDEPEEETTTTALPTTRRVVLQTEPTRPTATSTTQRVVQTTAAPVRATAQTLPPVRPTVPHIVMSPGDADSADSANRCAHPLDSGSCRGQFVRWYWDNQKQACDVFTYSGCEGNGNNFASKEECNAICLREPTTTTNAPDFSNVCKHDVDAGECNGIFQRFAFDTEAGECRPFTYGGCGGNGNNFATMTECRSKCQKAKPQSVNVCQFEIEAGECFGVFPRFAYDRETNDCRPFTYGGCGGNGNNFASISECRNVCIKKSCQPVGQCDLTRCQVVNDNRGCPFCSCSPIKLPNPTPPCPAVDVARCQEPCLIINNRRGCQECACPKVPSTIIPPVDLAPIAPEGRPPGSAHGPHAPATPEVIAPPASPSRALPPAPHFAAPTTESTIQGVPKGPLPPSLNAELEKCFQPLEPGPCKNFVDRWFFSQEDGTCHPFKYGGCAGNRNHFFTQKECEIHCARFLRVEVDTDSDDSQEEEPEEEKRNPSRPVVHGIPRVEVEEPLPVDNYKSPNPPVRGPYGKKNYEPVTTQGVKITTTTTSTTTTTTAQPTSTITTPLVEENADDETETVEEEEVATEAVQATTATQETEEEEEDEETSAPIVEEVTVTTSTRPITVSTATTSTAETAVSTTVPTAPSTATSTTATSSVPSEEEGVEETESGEDGEEPEKITEIPSTVAASEATTTVTSPESTTAASPDMPAPSSIPTSVPTSDSTSPASSTKSPAVIETTLYNEIDSMENDDGLDENEVSPPNTMMASSKFAVHRETEEVKKFAEVDPSATKLDAAKAGTLKKVEITRPPSTTTTTTTTTTSAPTTTSSEQTTASSTVSESITDTPTTTGTSTVPTTVTETSSTTSATTTPTKATSVASTRIVEISTTESTTAVPSTTAAASTTSSTTTTRSATASTPETLDSEEVPDIDFNKVIKTEGVSQTNVREPIQTPIGRQPVPTGPTGIIGRAMEPIDIDMDGLEEPTTVLPTTTQPVRPSTTAQTTTRAFRTLPQQTVTVQANSAVHNVRPNFDSSDPRIICSMPADEGICNNYVSRWFFNSHTGQCEQFSFGSCGGNLNNFNDRTSCELRCMAVQPALHSQVPERCSFEKDAGFGNGYNVKWYFNMRNLRCEQFVYQGQGGNSNQFETLSDCERFCSPQPTQPPRPTLAQLVTSTIAATPAKSAEPKTNSLRPLPETPITSNDNSGVDDADYSDLEKNDKDIVPEDLIPDISGLPTLAPVPPPRDNIAPNVHVQGPVLAVAPPGSEPQPPAAHGSKTLTEEERNQTPATSATTTTVRVAPTTARTAQPTEAATAAPATASTQPTYKADPLDINAAFVPRDNLPLVGASPKQNVNYATGELNKVQGIKNVEGRIAVDDLNEAEDNKNIRPSCPNGKKEFLYADGRPVMCLPGKNLCPDKAVCYFNGVDYFCCPNEEDPYDRHAFGGYGGEETRNGYKVFGPLRVRRLMDETPLRNKRQTSMDRAFNTNPVSFNLDSVVAPLRFDAEKPRHISKAGVMRRPVAPMHGNPMCILPLIKGDCSAAHLRYYYDRKSDSCRLFYYSGCQGNANNFGSLDDCQRLCVLGGQTAPAVQADAVTPATIVAPGQCPNGSPLGGNAPVLCGNSTDSIGCPSGYYCRSGPPDICCPGVDPSIKVVQHGVKVLEEATTVPGIPRNYYKEALLATPKYMCPDASDPLMGSNGQPLLCGAGFDGVKMCPKGYYCAIDGAKGSRLCCPLFGAAQRLPTETVIAPYFGRRNPNPGEVIDRGSLPSDQVEYQKKLAQSRSGTSSEETPASVNEQPSTTPKADDDDDDQDYEDNDQPQHLMKKQPTRQEVLQENAAKESPKVTDVDSEPVNIDVPTESPVPEDVAQPTTTPKYVADKSICHMKPTEGRACREDEKPPRTNLHYFYSAKDNRCKLYFYRGCGGNENRFEKKADCEALCLNA